MLPVSYCTFMASGGCYTLTSAPIWPGKDAMLQAKHCTSMAREDAMLQAKHCTSMAREDAMLQANHCTSMARGGC